MTASPGRFVQTWHTLYDPELARGTAKPRGMDRRVGRRGLTRVRLVHSNLEHSPRTWENVKDGWVWILDSMKTLLETGQTLPRVREEPRPPAPTRPSGSAVSVPPARRSRRA